MRAGPVAGTTTSQSGNKERSERQPQLSTTITQLILTRPAIEIDIKTVPSKSVTLLLRGDPPVA